MAKRLHITKRLRFEVFKRDSFTCQYCGAHPPKAILHIDHIHPVADGGTNDPDNLVTSCEQCNLGKGAVSLAAIPQSLKDKAHAIKEQEQQLRGYYEVIQSKRDRLDEEAWAIVDILNPIYREEGIRRDWLKSITKFVDELGYHPTLDAMEIAVCKKRWSDKAAFLYFCGICWNRIREADSNG